MKLIRLLPIALVPVLVQCGGEARPIQSAQAAPQVSASASAAAPAPARTYPIRMHWAHRVGVRTHAILDDDKRDQTVTRLPGQPANKSDKVTHAHLDGTLIVQEVDDKENARRTEIVVNEVWQTTGDGARVVLAPAGAHLMVTRAARRQDAQVTSNGQPASKELRDAMDGLLTLSIGGPTDDEVFGTAEPQAVGAEWGVNSAVAQKDLSDKGIVAGGMTGKVKLAGTERVRDVECLDLRVEFTVSGIESVSDLPPGSIVESGAVDAHMRGLFALSGNLARLGEEMETSTRMKVRVPTPQGNVQIDVKAYDRQRASYAPP
ncbi:MAG TPA: hypothetical protein VF316_00170 [Polyangiaceae bacterium]